MVQGGSARCHLPPSVFSAKPQFRACKSPERKDAADSQDLDTVLSVALLPVPTLPFEEGFPMSFDMQLLQGVHHLRRVLLRSEDQPQRRQFFVSSSAEDLLTVRACLMHNNATWAYYCTSLKHSHRAKRMHSVDRHAFLGGGLLFIGCCFFLSGVSSMGLSPR